VELKAEGLFRQGQALLAGREQSPQRAVALLTEAADLGHGGACLALGRRVGRDDPQAGLVWLRRGVELGDDGCRYEVAVRLLRGFGAPVDEVAAAELFQTAADHGHAWAAVQLTGLRRRQASRARTPQASLAAAIAEYDLQPHADRITAAVLPSVRLMGTPTRDEDQPVGASKLGGVPDLGPEVDWPRGAGGPLSFIAQINPSAVTTCLPGCGLAGGGLLSFFYDADAQPWGLKPGDRAGWRVVYAADTGSLRRTAPPGGVAAFRAVALSPQLELTLPAGRTMEARAFGLDDDAWDRYIDLRDVFADDFQPQDSGTARHRMFGHPDAIQGDMRRRIEATLRGGVDLDAAATPELDEAAKRWMLLLQVDSDNDAEMMWGDAGRLFFWITREAFLAGDFSAMFVQLQCN